MGSHYNLVGYQDKICKLYFDGSYRLGSGMSIFLKWIRDFTG